MCPPARPRPGRSRAGGRRREPARSPRPPARCTPSRRKTPSSGPAFRHLRRCARAAHREPGPVQADQQPAPERPRQPGHRRVQGGDVVLRVVGGRVPWPRVNHQDVVGVVTRRQVRAEADAAFVRGHRLIFPGRGEHDRGVQVDHRHAGQLTAGDLQPREPLRPGREQAPPVPAELGYGGVEPGQLQVPGLRQGPPHRRRRGNRAGQRRQVRQRLEIADRLTAGDQHQSQVGQELAAVI